MKRRDFFKTMGTAAIATAAVTSMGALANVKKSRPAVHSASAPLAASAPLDGIAMADLVRSGKATPKEMVQEAISKIEKTNDKINAVIHTHFDAALKRAETININRPFAGVPFLIKDGVDYADLPNTSGSKLLANNRPEKTSCFLKACENAGLNVIGSTNIPELMTLPSTENALYGATRNPWDLSKGVAGSTGGGAAAVAAGYTPIIHATDGGGSVRMPASACGIFGFKPSRELLITGSPDGSPDAIFTHQCFISRSVRDAALATSLTEDHLKVNDEWPRVPLGYVNQPLRRKLKVGVTLPSVFGKMPDQYTQDAIHSTAKLLTELGHDVVEVQHPVTGGEAFYYHYMGVFGGRMADLGHHVESSTGMKLEESNILTGHAINLVRLIQGRLKKNPDYIEQSSQYMQKFAIQHNRTFFSDIDVWLTPVTLKQVPDTSWFNPVLDHDLNELNHRAEQYMSYTILENPAGNPAMSVPLYWAENGVPVGSHLSAGRGEDRLLFELAYQLEEARPWAHKTAPLYI